MRSFLFVAFAMTAILLGLNNTVKAQVFAQADGAVVGYTPQGSGQGLYGAFGLDSADDPEFLIYRKFTERANQTPQAVATNVDGNLGEVEWSGINQRAGADEGITAPGMFIGTRNHTTEDGWVVSNPDQLLYFKGQFDNTGSANTNDSNLRTNWDTRVGFMENPDNYIDFVQPNSSQLDLWTGQYNTDAVYSQNLIRGDDSAETTNITQQHGRGGSFFLQSGSELTSIQDERDRTSYELMRTRAGTGEELARGGHIDAGVDYDDPIEVSWGMRLNDPENSDAILAREVQFWVKTGNIIASGIFDPADMNDPADEPPNVNDFEFFTDEEFNWREAIPVFFAGGQGNIGDGTGLMGIFTPGDFGADGAVNLDDFNRLASNFGDSDTTYSRGDQTQDGITDQDDAAAWADVAGDAVKSEAIAAVSADVDAGGDLYDFDGSGATDAADLTFVTELLGVVALAGDCNGDGVIDASDLACVTTIEDRDIVLDQLNTLPGDLDGNGDIAFADFLVLSANFGDPTKTAYTDGNVDLMGDVAFADFLLLSANFGLSGDPAAAVPEPQSVLLLGLGALMVGTMRRRRR